MALGDLFKEFIEKNELAKQFCDFISVKIEEIGAKIEEYQRDFSNLIETKKEAEKFLDGMTGKNEPVTEAQADVNNNNLKGDNMEEETVVVEEVAAPVETVVTEEVKTEEAAPVEVVVVDEVKAEEVAPVAVEEVAPVEVEEVAPVAVEEVAPVAVEEVAPVEVEEVAPVAAEEVPVVGAVVDGGEL